MGEPKSRYFYDFGICECTPCSPNQYYLSFETPGYINKVKTHPQTFSKYIIFINPNLFIMLSRYITSLFAVRHSIPPFYTILRATTSAASRFWLLGVPFLHFGVPFLHFGSTLENHGSSRMDTRWFGT